MNAGGILPAEATAPRPGSLDDIAGKAAAANALCERLISELADAAGALSRANVAQLSALRDEMGRVDPDGDDNDLMRLMDRVHRIHWSQDVLATAGIGLGPQSPILQLRIGSDDGVDLSGELRDAIEDRKRRRREKKEAADREAEERLIAEHPEIARLIQRKVDEAVPLNVRPRRRVEGSYTGPGQVGHPIVPEDEE